MKPFFSLLLVLFSCLSSLGNFNFFTADLDESGSKIILNSPLSTLPVSGHIPMVLEIKNGTSQALEVEVTFGSSGTYGLSSGISGVHRVTMTAPANETASRWVMVPVGFTQTYGYGDSLTINANSNSSTSKTLSSSLSLGSGSRGSGSGDSYIFVAMSQHLFTHNGSKISSGYAGSQVTAAANNNSLASFDPKFLPTDPRAYSGIDLLILSNTEWKALSSDIRQTLTAWINGGGNLVVAKAGGLATPSDLKIEPHHKKSNSNYKIGLGNIFLISTDSKGQEFNRSQLVSLPNIAPVMNAAVAPSGGDGSLTESIEGNHSNRLLLVFILLAFAVLVGPVNLFVFAPLGQRHRLFVTTPIIAIGTSVILAVGVVIGDGFGGEGSRVALVEIENLGEQHRAHITQEQAAHLGIVFGTDFKLEPGTSIKPFSSLGTEFSQLNPATLSSASFKLITEDTSEGIDAKGEWISSRSDVAHQLHNQRLDRGSVTITGNAENKEVSHSLTYALESFYYRDSSGQLWFAASVPTGTATKLQKSNLGKMRDDLKAASNMLSNPLKNKLKTVLQQNNRFYAISQEFPMIETLDSIDWQSSNALVTGHIKPQP